MTKFRSVFHFPVSFPRKWKLRTGRTVGLRLIKSSDRTALAQFHRQLSEKSVYSRYLYQFALKRRISQKRITQICLPDLSREVVVVAILFNSKKPTELIAGIGRLSRLENTTAEIAIVVRDDFQRQGIGTELVHLLLGVAKMSGLQRVHAEAFADNEAVRKIGSQIPYPIKYYYKSGIVELEISFPKDKNYAQEFTDFERELAQFSAD